MYDKLTDGGHARCRYASEHFDLRPEQHVPDFPGPVAKVALDFDAVVEGNSRSDCSTNQLVLVSDVDRISNLQATSHKDKHHTNLPPEAHVQSPERRHRKEQQIPINNYTNDSSRNCKLRKLEIMP